MNHREGNTIRGKMEQLDTLSGGIVFGKEEAWEKLQARLEAKPVVNISVRYWLAAAAIVIFFVCVMVVTKHPEKEVAKKEVKSSGPVLNMPAETSVTETNHAVYVGHKPGEPAAVTARSISGRAPAKIESQEEKADPANTPAVRAETAHSELATVNPGLLPRMKVVHINEIEGGRNASAPVAADHYKVAETDFRKMPVVHIADVEQEAAEVKILLRENRMSLGRYPFKQPAPDNIIRNDEESQESHYLIRNMFNPQN